MMGRPALNQRRVAGVGTLTAKRRNTVFIGCILLLILAMYSILSSTPMVEEMPPDGGPIVIAENNAQVDTLKQRIANLQTEQTENLDEISTLKETIQRLERQMHDHEAAPQQTQQSVNDNSPSDANTNDAAPQTAATTRKASTPSNSNLITPAFGAPFELIPESEIIYPRIAMSNAGISDTPNSPNARIVTDMHDENVIYEADSGVIHGNPLLIEKCQTALTADHELNILSSIAFYHNRLVPWFWSRESIGSVLQNQVFEQRTAVLASDMFDNATNAIYVQVDNSASEMMQKRLLTSLNSLQPFSVAVNTRVQSQCGFTFVQHPITRFIAAYFQVNGLLWTKIDEIEFFPDLFEQLSFPKIKKTLKARLKAFVNDLRKFHYLFTRLFEWMHLLSSQSGQISVAQMDLAHIFKYEFIKQEYENILNDPNDRFCIDESDHFVFNNEMNADDEQWSEWLHGFGIDMDDAYLRDEKFREWMGLKVNLTDDTTYMDMDRQELRRMDILYIYDAMDYEIYSKVVEYYWQDFVCFDYRADYRHDVLEPLIKYQTKYPGFPVINRTETNWDRILKHYYSKH